jgi:hypothetical protein
VKQLTKQLSGKRGAAHEIRPFETDVGRLIIAARQAYDLMTYAVEKKNPAELQTSGVRTAIRFTPVTQDKGR